MTDHKAMAEEYVDFTFRYGATEEARLGATAKAQVHATLYAAEQQQAANELTKQIIIAMCVTMTGSQAEMFRQAQASLMRT